MKEHRIGQITPGSAAEAAGIRAGEALLAVNGEPVEDVFDYEFLSREESLRLLIRGEDGSEREVLLHKEEDEDAGLDFGNGLMDDYHSCCNSCIFCFIDQMPPGMRETLYFKDDDTRLSFLQGNYITLTNLDDHDVARIIRYRLQPINISVHTTNPELRNYMLGNRFAGESLKILDRLYEAGISMNGQIVLCPGINDGKELDRTVRDLSRYLPVMESVSCVPAGLTKYREGLPKLRSFTPQEAGEVIDLIESWQRKLYPEHGLHFIHASDEFYYLAGRPMPEAERYDGYLQLENGVGMTRLFEDDFHEELARHPFGLRRREISVATGYLSAPSLTRLAAELHKRFPFVKVHIYPIRNDFFGESITVAGLITGGDLIRQLKGKTLGTRLYLPLSMLRSGEDVFLDDVHVSEAERELGVPVEAIDCGGADLVRAFLGIREKKKAPLFRPYEPGRGRSDP